MCNLPSCRRRGFNRGPQQLVSSLAFRLQRPRLDRRFLLCEVVLTDRVVLGDSVDDPIGSEEDRISRLTNRKSKSGGELLRTAEIGNRSGSWERLARLHLETEGLGCRRKVFTLPRPFYQRFGTGLCEVHGLFMAVVAQYAVTDFGQRSRMRRLNILDGQDYVAAVCAQWGT